LFRNPTFGGALVEFSDGLRKNAADCFRWAQDAGSLEDRAAWLSMAQFWLQLAQFAEEQALQRGGAPTSVFNDRQKGSDRSEPPE
jgi:hypothetical protein